MKLVYMPPGALIPYEKNAKEHPEKQIAALAKVITEFGFDQPIVVDQNNVIIKGHGRRLAALRLKLEEVPVVVRDIASNDARFLRVADNKVNSLEWDAVAVKHELQELSALDFDLDLTLFETAEIAALENIEERSMAGSIAITLGDTTHECPTCNYKW